jgi:hypothetical protein
MSLSGISAADGDNINDGNNDNNNPNLVPDNNGVGSNPPMASKPTEVSQSSVISAAKTLNSHVAKNKKLPNSVLVAGYRYSMPEFLYLMSKTISNKKIKSNSPIKIKYDIGNPNKPSGTGSKGQIYSYYYCKYADTIIKSIDKTNRAPNFITTAGGNKLQYQSIIFLFGKILSSTKKDLPYFVSVNIKRSTSYNRFMPQYDRNIQFTTTTIGQDERGYVQLIGSMGDPSSKTKIAYIIGVHPLEHNAHKSLYDNLITRTNSLKYKYYIYKVTVTQGASDYEVGRMNGQLLAQKYVLPHIKNNKYKLVVDVHANQGTRGGNYKKTNFIFAPLNHKASKTIADTLIKRIPGLSYYFPESQTSPHYITNPLVNAKIKTIIYETYVYESKATTDKYMKGLIANVDTLNL